MKNLTAVEWLQEQLKDGVKYNPLEKNGYSNAEQRLFQQAKEMEKKQLIDAYNNGQQIPPFEYSEQYYNETYNKTI